MSKKKNIQELLEAHLDKIVLGVIALVSLYLLWAFVLGNPYGAQIGGRNIGPARIDLQNQREARQLEERLGEPAQRIEYDLRLTAEFDDLLRTSLPQLAVQRIIPLPGAGEEVIDDDRVYPTPEIVALTDVQVAALRGAVFKPVEEVSPEIPYPVVETELADLDLVSVSGRVDIATLYRNFQQSFTGPRLNAAWKEPTFAKPVIARLELQRRQKRADGSWSDWNTLPPTQIDPFRRLKEQTPMTTDAMEFGGVMLWLRQYEDPRVQINLLQPTAYDFASVQTGWLPPNYLDESKAILKRLEEEFRRQQREERLQSRETGADDMMPGVDRRQPTRAPTRTPTRPQPQPRGGQRDTMPGTMPGPPPRTTAAAARRERTLDDVMRDMQQERIDEQTKLESRSTPLLVWTHDDTTRPGETYQYRVRLGVFNPIAGRNWFREDQQHYKNQVVLWSAYSEPTAQVEIPQMLHLFPTDVLARETGGGVKVDVARYYLGQWRTQAFEVFPGQLIGQSVEYTPPAPPAARTSMMTDMGMGMMDGGMYASDVSGPQEVDFATPYMLVDLNSRVEWGANFSNRSEYWQMLYHGPEQSLLAMPVGSRYWPADMRRQQDEIKNAEQNAMPLNMIRSTQPGMMQDMMPGIAPRDRRMPGGMPDDFMMLDMY